MAGFGVDAAFEASGRSVCVTATGDEPFSVRLDLNFAGVTQCDHPAELFSRKAKVASGEVAGSPRCAAAV